MLLIPIHSSSLLSHPHLVSLCPSNRTVLFRHADYQMCETALNDSDVYWLVANAVKVGAI
jgi:heptaprenylglyceryl phosphate synthase